MYKLYADNVVTKGINRDLLVDFSRNKITLIPKSITLLIESLDSNTKAVSADDKKIINDLLANEIIFELDADESELFPKLNLEWDFPADISNAVIEVVRNNSLQIKEIMEELEKLNCLYFTFIISEEINDYDINILQEILFNSSIISFSLVLNYFKSERLFSLIDSIKNLPRLKNKIIVFNCNDTNFEERFVDLISIRKVPYNHNCCGCIKKDNFNINLYLYTESQNHNTCLNRKISIDGKGYVKNCLSMKENYGNFKDIFLKDIVDKDTFKKYWNITKDKIEVCKDCEFRNICTDCRAFIDSPSNIYSKPLKCGYNPYSNVWEEWSLNPLKQKAIEFYSLK